MELDEYRAAYEGRVGADRMAMGLGIIPDKLRGDMDEVKRLRDALQKIASQDYRGNRSTESQLAYHALNTPNVTVKPAAEKEVR